MTDTPEPISAIRWLPCRNDFGDTIPAFSAVECTEIDADGTLVVTRPTQGNLKMVFFTGPSDIPVDAYGSCTMDYPVIARYYDGDPLPNNPDRLGTFVGQFTLHVNRSGFLVVGGIDTDNKRITVVQEVCRFD